QNGRVQHYSRSRFAGLTLSWPAPIADHLTWLSHSRRRTTVARRFRPVVALQQQTLQTYTQPKTANRCDCLQLHGQHLKGCRTLDVGRGGLQMRKEGLA